MHDKPALSALLHHLLTLCLDQTAPLLSVSVQYGNKLGTVSVGSIAPPPEPSPFYRAPEPSRN